MKMLTSQNKSAYNDPVITKKVMIGCGSPNRTGLRSVTGLLQLRICFAQIGKQARRSLGRLRLFDPVLRYFFDCPRGILRFYIRERISRRFRSTGLPTRGRLACLLGRGQRDFVTLERSLAMQANNLFEPYYDIGFVLLHLQDRSLKPEQAVLSAKNFRMMARCILKVLPDSLHHPMESYADKFDQSFVLDAANGLLEAADYLDSVAEQKRN